MTPRRSDLDGFVRDALMAGRSRDAIAGALSDAGWRARDVDRAMGAWADTGFTPPVPRPQAFVTARDAFIYGLTFVALIVGVVNIVAAFFDLIEFALGTTTRLNLSWNVAALLVFVPVFMLLDRRTRGDDRDAPLRKIFAYGALFFASLVLLADLVAVLALLIGGGLGAEVALKSLVVGLISALVLLYYRTDLAEDTRPPRRPE